VCVKRVTESDEEASAKSGFVKVAAEPRNGLAAKEGSTESIEQDLAGTVPVVWAKMSHLVVQKAKLFPEEENHGVMVTGKEVLRH